jgi:hypothetical protein
MLIKIKSTRHEDHHSALIILIGAGSVSKRVSSVQRPPALDDGNGDSNHQRCSSAVWQRYS